ncbi:type II toxin-antitoxin system RelE/ParE family toxin [Phyllobacterium sp. LjRoot231]|uniref:type II toxin-antitoxin system RelE/ParE family toxin n=1 Tax=Phyllobacterium sp. LjRoot231 TaxID=3342289 RepID=UPI003ECFB3E6
MKLEWSAFALADRDEIFDYIEQDSPHMAVIVDDRISSQIRRLTQFPESGRRGRIDGTRELVIHQTPYIAAYRISGNTVRILRLLHSAQQWPDDMVGAG